MFGLDALWWTTFFIIGVAVEVGVGVGEAVCAKAATGAKTRAALMPMAASCFNISFLRSELVFSTTDSGASMANST